MTRFSDDIEPSRVMTFEEIDQLEDQLRTLQTDEERVAYALIFAQNTQYADVQEGSEEYIEWIDEVLWCVERYENGDIGAHLPWGEHNRTRWCKCHIFQWSENHHFSFIMYK